MAESERKFYVLRAVSGKENKVREYLESEIKNLGLQDYISQVLIPTEKVFQQRNGKKVLKERAYLPGYIIIEAILVGEVIHFLKNVNYVIGFLGGDKPVPLRSSEVNRILGKVDELQDLQEELLDVQYTIGETVKVIYGPFNGFHGEIKEINAEKKKLTVLVKIFGRGTPLELGYLQVEKE
ncbi:transcription termination/antitermination protein NusG [Bacteroidia bacterium]|nr:transcription termination/antitermination protein NusG [Bacteroidia bacterium]GHV08775.1 transcription termination/antitermination protein NusG [Bacteroidia bacterium]